MAQQLASRFALVRGVLDEVRALRWLREWPLWALLLLAMLLWTLAYQSGGTFRLAVGGDRATHQREDDRPFLQPAGQTYYPNVSFNASQPTVPDKVEVEWWQLPEAPYRWTTADAAMAFPGVGGGRWLVTAWASGQPTGQPTPSRWSDGTITATASLSPDLRVYHLLANASAAGDLALRFQTDPFPAPNDTRSLGFRMHGIALAPLGGPPWPAWPQLGTLAATLALCYGIARRLGARPIIAALGGVALASLLALLLANARLWLTIFTPALLPLMLGCYGLAVVLLCVGNGGRGMGDERWGVEGRGEARFAQEPPTANRQLPTTNRQLKTQNSKLKTRPIIALIVLAFALRMGGILHPHTIFSDIGLNANKIIELTAGRVYVTAGLPSEAGGGVAPYPPGQFIALAPGQLLLPVNDDGRRLLVKIGGALLDSMVLGLLWLVLRRAGAGQAAALFGAALYIAPTPLLISFSVGEYANIFGQGLALPLLAVFASGAVREWRATGAVRSFLWRWLAVLALMLVALLGHLGVAISLATMLFSLVLVWLLAPMARRMVVPLVAVGVAAAACAMLFYYSAFAELLSARFVGGAGGAGEPLSLAAKLLHQQQLLTISPALLALGAAGALLPLRARGGWLRLALAAWWLGTALSFGLLLLANQAVRWQHFLYPALCLGGGILFGALWRRGQAARLVAACMLALLLWQAVAGWFVQLIDYLH